MYLLFMIPGIMLLLALLNLPYEYYLLLRVVVSACGGYIAYIFYNKNQKWIYFLAAAILFNPIFPVHLTKGIWMFFNLGFAYLFLTSKKDAF